MRLHTKLTYSEVWQALTAAKNAGRVTDDVTTVVMKGYGSRTHERSFEVQLGTYNQNSLPPGTRDQHGKVMHSRRFKNTGIYGAGLYGNDRIWAATYDEWGWFMAEVFRRDPEARFGPKPKPDSPGRSGIYDGRADFNLKTGNRFKDGK